MNKKRDQQIIYYSKQDVLKFVDFKPKSAVPKLIYISVKGLGFF